VSFFEDHYVTAVDGIRLHLRIKGGPEDRTPVLYLHGGPGGGLNLAAFETYAGPYLEPHFPVAYLHQRGVLRSRGSAKTDHSLALHIQDIRAVTAFLRQRFQRPRVYLLGHSWGGFTGCAYLQRNASTVAGLVAICPVVSFPRVQQELYSLVSKKVWTGGDPTARKELASIGKPPYPDIDDFIRLQGLAVERLGDPYAYISVRDLAGHTGYDFDMDRCLAIQVQIAASLWSELYTLDLTPTLEKLGTPLLMMACGMDGAVPWTSVKSAFSAYGKSRPGVNKQWFHLESGNHLPFTEPANRQRCMDTVVTFLRTLETKREPTPGAGSLLKND
jgi:pimeloyl-ACP methyl ester carboxylesterase